MDVLPSRMVSVSCGHFHTACVSAAGDLFTWGRSTWGRLGRPTDEVCRCVASSTSCAVGRVGGEVAHAAHVGGSAGHGALAQESKADAAPGQVLVVNTATGEPRKVDSGAFRPLVPHARRLPMRKPTCSRRRVRWHPCSVLRPGLHDHHHAQARPNAADTAPPHADCEVSHNRAAHLSTAKRWLLTIAAQCPDQATWFTAVGGSARVSGHRFARHGRRSSGKRRGEHFTSAPRPSLWLACLLVLTHAPMATFLDRSDATAPRRSAQQ